MNKNRKMRLQKAISEFAHAKDEIEAILNEEQEAFDNLPESLQESERGDEMQEYIDHLTEAMDALNEAENELDCVE